MDNKDLGLLILRIAVGGLMIFHGIAKIIHGTGFIETTFQQLGIPSIMAYTVYITEVVAPLMLVAGWRTRIAGLLITGTMVVVMFLVMPEKLGQLTQTGAWALELQALFALGGLALFFTGGGKYALSRTHKLD